MSRAPTWRWAWYMPARNAPDSSGGRGTTLIIAEPADLCSPPVLTANAETGDRRSLKPFWPYNARYTGDHRQFSA
jgi:hypothetical protein